MRYAWGVRRVWGIGVRGTVLGVVLVAGAGCPGVDVEPSVASAVARVTGTDGTGAAGGPVTLALDHAPGTASPRVATAAGGLQNVTGIDLAVTRSGVPLAETYVLLTLSQSRVGPESGDVNTATAGPAFVRRHVGDLARAVVETSLLDAPLTDAFADFPPPVPAGDELRPVRPHGESYLARIEEDDPAIPFNDPGALTDVSRLAGMLSGAILAGVTTAAAAPGAAFRLGGADGAGELRTYFVPHMTHSTATLPARNVQGVGFIVALTVDVLDPLANTVPIGTADVFIPLSLLFEKDGGAAPFRLFVDPVSMVGSTANPPDNVERVFVSGRGGLLDALIAGEVRSAVVAAITALPAGTLATVDAGLELLAAVLDATLGEAAAAVPDDFDVILLPEGPLDGVERNRLAGGGDGIPARLHVLL